MPKQHRLILSAYSIWIALAVVLPLMKAGFSAENITRVLVLAFLLVQLAVFPLLKRTTVNLKPASRFMLLGVFLASVVEGFHMISKPVFQSLRVSLETGLVQGLADYAIDLVFTIPAYLIIFRVIWFYINRYNFSLWQYIFIMGIGQTLGDGLFFFLNAPAMLLFLPYPMLNYHAMNVIPFLCVCDELRPDVSKSFMKALALIALVAVYLICGAAIAGVGSLLGYRQ